MPAYRSTCATCAHLEGMGLPALRVTANGDQPAQLDLLQTSTIPEAEEGSGSAAPCDQGDEPGREPPAPVLPYGGKAPRHRDARETEELAAASIDPILTELQRRVLACLREYGPQTPDEVAERLKIYRYTVAPRFRELFLMEKIAEVIEPDGKQKKRRTPQGGWSGVWGIL